MGIDAELVLHFEDRSEAAVSHMLTGNHRTATLHLVDAVRAGATVILDPGAARRLARALDMAANYLDRVDEKEPTPCPTCKGRPYYLWTQGGDLCRYCDGRGFVMTKKEDDGERK